LNISEAQNALLFTTFGAAGLISQSFLVGRVSKRFGMKKAFSSSLFITAVSFVLMYFSRSLFAFIVAMTLLSLVNSIAQTLIPTILSQMTDEISQGSIMGLNTSYQSIGMIIGPILGGAVATIAIPYPFLVGAALMILCFILSFWVLRPGAAKESAF
jgi:DHA1 family multidrug resistance protein-like MFS transporter